MESRAAKLPADPGYYQLLRSSRRVVSKATTDTMPVRHKGTWPATSPWRVLSSGWGQHSRARGHPLLFLNSHHPDLHPLGPTWPRAGPLLVPGLSGTACWHQELETGACSPASPTAKRMFALSLLPGLLLFGSKFSSHGCYLLLLHFFFFLLVIKLPASGDSKMTQKAKSNFFHRWIVAEGGKCKCSFSSVLHFGGMKGL